MTVATSYVTTVVRKQPVETKPQASQKDRPRTNDSRYRILAPELPALDHAKGKFNRKRLGVPPVVASPRLSSTIVTPRRPVKERLGPLEPTKAHFSSILLEKMPRGRYVRRRWGITSLCKNRSEPDDIPA